MAMLMSVVKLDESEVDSVKKMIAMNRKPFNRLLASLPYVEPDHQPVVAELVEYHWNLRPEESGVSSRELDNLAIFTD